MAGAVNACGPFGDPPPDTLSEATSPSAWEPGCSGRGMIPMVLARYACAYEPTPVEARGRFPMVVYLHPSMFGTETIRLTNLLHYQDSVSLRGDRKKGRVHRAGAGGAQDHPLLSRSL